MATTYQRSAMEIEANRRGEEAMLARARHFIATGRYSREYIISLIQIDFPNVARQL